MFFVCLFVFVERLEYRLSSNRKCPKKEALASNEFISKFKIRADQNSQLPEDERLEEQMEAANLSDGSDESQGKPNGQMWSPSLRLGEHVFTSTHSEMIKFA